MARKERVLAAERLVSALHGFPLMPNLDGGHRCGGDDLLSPASARGSPCLLCSVNQKVVRYSTAGA